MKTVETMIASDRAKLADVPVGAIHELLEDFAQGAWNEPEGLRLLMALRVDGRPAVRRGVAQTVGRLVGSLTVTEALQILYSLSDDQDVGVREEVARALAAWLARAEDLWQIVIVEQWAASPMRLTRETLAKAFSFPFPSPVSDLALELLARDPVPSVRLEVVKAIRARIDEDPRGYGELLRQLAADLKGPVRWQARRWLRWMASSAEARFAPSNAATTPDRPVVSLGASPSFELA